MKPEISKAEEERVRKEVRVYIIVFAALLFFTLLTVTISSLHPRLVWGIIIALTIAVLKGGLVASYFMHLISEKAVIYALLAVALVLLLMIIGLPYFESLNQY